MKGRDARPSLGAPRTCSCALCTPSHGRPQQRNREAAWATLARWARPLAGVSCRRHLGVGPNLCRLWEPVAREGRESPQGPTEGCPGPDQARTGRQPAPPGSPAGPLGPRGPPWPPGPQRGHAGSPRARTPPLRPRARAGTDTRASTRAQLVARSRSGRVRGESWLFGRKTAFRRRSPNRASILHHPP